MSAKSLVIIDDTEDLRDLLSMAMGRDDFDIVGEASDGKAGIEIVKEKQPDVVLLDLAMPVMDGMEALPHIRRIIPQGKIVVLSGFGAQQMSARAMASGADGYIQKGAPLNTIIDYVKDMAQGVKPQHSIQTAKPSGDSDGTPGRRLAAPMSKGPGRLVPSGLARPMRKPGRPPAPPSPAVPTGTRLSSAPPAPPAVHAASSAQAEVGIPAPRTPSAQNLPAASDPANSSAIDAMRLAPYGVFEVADEPLLRLRYANPVAARILGTNEPGTPLGTISSDLASQVSYYRLDPDSSFEVTLAGGHVRAVTRRAEWSILVYLDSTKDDVNQLRRAIATTAHEIRGPVSVLTGVAETIGWSHHTLTQDKRDRLLAAVGRQARMLDSITADLLTAAQIQRGTLKVDLQELSPRTIIEGSIGERYEVEVNITDDRMMRADPLRVEQMLTNLLSNAMKYGLPPFKINVLPEGEYIRIDVIDCGEGVPEEFADHLFEEFARASTSVASGTGLGLYVVRTLARAQGGDVVYRPATGAEGSGSVFSVTLRAV